MAFVAESQDKWTITDVKYLFPQTELHKAEGKERGRQRRGSAWRLLEEYPEEMTQKEQWRLLLLVLDTHLQDPSDVTPSWGRGHLLCRSCVGPGQGGSWWGSILQTRELRLN